MPTRQPDPLARLDRAQSANPALQFIPDSTGVEIRLQDPPLGYYHSFIRGSLARRAGQSDQALLRACNNKQRSIRSVLDLTGGWGADALTLANHGRSVRLLEQNAAIHAVIAYSFACLVDSAKHAAIAQRLQIERANSLEYLRTQTSVEYDCIYLDPMFPAHKSGAKPAKEMQILQALTENLDIERCFELALLRARKRVVVKRPTRAPVLASGKPDLVYREKSIRFDIYLTG